MTKRSHNHDGRYAYGFLPSGFFTLINRDGDSIYEISVPLLEKLGSHLIWIFLWTALTLYTRRVVLFTPLIFLHITLFGARLTTLLLKGSIRPLIFPPLWIRLTRRFQRGEEIGILEEHALTEHPGLLANLAFARLARGDEAAGKALLRRALDLLDQSNEPESPTQVAHSTD